MGDSRRSRQAREKLWGLFMVEGKAELTKVGRPGCCVGRKGISSLKIVEMWASLSTRVWLRKTANYHGAAQGARALALG